MMSIMSSASLAPPAKNRVTRELSMLSTDPPPGISCYAPTDNLTYLHATITGPPETPFESAIYLLTVNIPNRYPFEPPRVRFVTPIHHPNIDSSGRICLDTLKSPPAGSWSPAVSLPSLLLSIRSLMADPNASDGLVASVTQQFQENYEAWFAEASQLAKMQATDELMVQREEELIREQTQQLLQQQNDKNGSANSQRGKKFPLPKRPKMFQRGIRGKEDQEQEQDRNCNGDIVHDAPPQAVGKRKRDNDNDVGNGSESDGNAKRDTKTKHTHH